MPPVVEFDEAVSVTLVEVPPCELVASPPPSPPSVVAALVELPAGEPSFAAPPALALAPVTPVAPLPAELLLLVVVVALPLMVAVGPTPVVTEAPVAETLLAVMPLMPATELVAPFDPVVVDIPYTGAGSGEEQDAAVAINAMVPSQCVEGLMVNRLSSLARMRQPSPPTS